MLSRNNLLDLNKSQAGGGCTSTARGKATHSTASGCAHVTLAPLLLTHGTRSEASRGTQDTIRGTDRSSQLRWTPQAGGRP